MFSRFAELVRPLLCGLLQYVRTARVVDVLTVTSVPAVSAQGSVAASPATVDAMFATILQTMNDPTAPQASAMPVMVVAAQNPGMQSAATPLGGIIAVLQNKVAAATPADLPNNNTAMDSGPLVVPADTLAQDSSDPNGTPVPRTTTPYPPTVATRMPAPQTPAADQNADTIAAAPTDPAPTDAAPVPAAPVRMAVAPEPAEVPVSTDASAPAIKPDGQPVVVASSGAAAGDEQPIDAPQAGKTAQQDPQQDPRQDTASTTTPVAAQQPSIPTPPVPQPVPSANQAPAPTSNQQPAQAEAQQEPTITPVDDTTGGDNTNQPVTNAPTPVANPKTAKGNAGKTAVPPQSPVQPQQVAAQPAPKNAAVVTDDSEPQQTADRDTSEAQPQQPATQQTADAQPAAVYVTPMPAPTQAAPAAKAAGDDTSSVKTEAAKNAGPQLQPDTADQNAPAMPSKPHDSAAAQPAAQQKADVAAPANDQHAVARPDPIASSDSTATANNTGADTNSAPQAATASNNPAPQHHASTPTPPVPPNVAAPQAAPLHKLNAGLQVSAQEQETTSTLDKLGVSIVTRATEGLRHFDIRLDPPELGRVDIRLSVDDSGKAQASLLVDKPQTLEMLQRDSSSLNRALTDAGLDLSNNGLNFSLRDQTRQNDGGVDQGRGRALSAKAVVQTDATSIHSSIGSYAPNSVRLDIRV